MLSNLAQLWSGFVIRQFQFACACSMGLAVALSPTNAQDLALHGSNTIGAELAPALTRSFLTHVGADRISVEETAAQEMIVRGVNEAGNSISVEIEAHGSGTAFDGLASGGAHIGMASRRIRDREQVELATLGDLRSPAAEYVLGLDGIAVVVHPSNPVDRLTIDQIRRIFAGQVRDWSEVGGPAGLIRRYARDDASGTFDTFESLVLQDTALAPARRFESNANLSDAVAADPLGVGFTGLPFVREAKAIAVAAGGAAVAPSAFTVATEDYPLARRLYLYLPPDNDNPLAQALLEFAIGAGQQLVSASGFVGQDIVSYKPQLPADAPEDYRNFVAQAERLSMNFRFEQGSVELDTKALRDLERLQTYMNAPENQAKRVLLMGFADRREVSPYLSLSLSNDRVDYVARRLQKLGVTPSKARGFGAAVPVVAADSPLAAEKNRRVEVWLAPPMAGTAGSR